MTLHGSAVVAAAPPSAGGEELGVSTRVTAFARVVFHRKIPVLSRAIEAQALSGLKEAYRVHGEELRASFGEHGRAAAEAAAEKKALERAAAAAARAPRFLLRLSSTTRHAEARARRALPAPGRDGRRRRCLGDTAQRAQGRAEGLGRRRAGGRRGGEESGGGQKEVVKVCSFSFLVTLGKNRIRQINRGNEISLCFSIPL